MIRLFHVHFPARTLILALSDTLLVPLALVIAILVWFGSDANLTISYENGLAKIAVASAICMLCMHYYDLYDSFVFHSPGEMLTRLVQVFGTVCMVLALLYYAYPVVTISRGPVLLWVSLAGLCLGTSRKVFYSVNRSPHLRQRVLFLGADPVFDGLAREIEKRPELGLELVGSVGSASDCLNGSRVDRIHFLGCPEDLTAVVERERVNRIILTMDDPRGTLPVSELLTLKQRGTVIDDATDVYEAIAGKIDLSSLRHGRLLFSESNRVSGLILFYKRAGSIILSAVGLLLSLPLMLLIFLAIRLDSPGPAIFRQRRVGKDGRDFTLYKFRSMVQGSDASGNSKPAEKHDMRFTRAGRWLRRSRLDELPQLYNILVGDMYLIGPRPFTRDMEDELKGKIPFYEQRWNIKPGATGWAQIHNGYCASVADNVEKLSYDLFYIKNISIGLDILIFFQTIKILVLGRGSR